MKNFKIVLQKKHNEINDDFIRIVKTIPALTKQAALVQISKFENFNEFEVLSCQVRKS